MPRILVIEGFKFAVDGLHVIEVEPGEQEVSERCAEVAVEHLKVATWLDAAPPGPAKIALQAPVLPIVTTQAPLVAGEVVPVVAAPAAPAAVKPATPAKPAAKPKAPVKPAAKPKATTKAKPGGAA